jgi:CheY-like chemotaxis protein
MRLERRVDEKENRRKRPMTRILFIDDDVLALQLMSKVTSLLGYQPMISTSPVSALQLLSRERPELIFVDMMMDEMDGPEFVRSLRSRKDAKDIPVLIYSAGSSYRDEETARAAGASGYLQKPIGLKELAQAVLKFATKH